MSYFAVVILGIVQGVAEFLPISSSGHLAIVRNFFEIKENAMAIDVAFHFGTLLSLIFFYRQKILKICKLYRQKKNELTVRFIPVLIGIIPVSIIGFFFGSNLESYFESPNYPFLFITGVILFSIRFAKDSDAKHVSKSQALIIGLFQIFALLPGISRAGITIASALHLNVERKHAAEFSFFMAVPLLTGASILKFNALFCLPVYQIKMIAVGVFISFISGIIALKLVLSSLSHHKFYLFSWYCWAVSVCGIFLF